MAIKRGATSVVVRGAWNPAIISPSWLLQYKVVEGSPTNLRIMVTTGGNRVAFDFDKVKWTVDASRLEIKAQEFVDCGSYAARLLGLLPHTPIKAIGTTFTFMCPVGEWPQAELPNLGDIRLTPQPKYADLRQIQWSCVRALSETTRLQMSVTQLREKDVLVALNFHRNTTEASAAAEYAAGWSEDVGVAVTVLRDMFGIEL